MSLNIHSRSRKGFIIAQLSVAIMILTFVAILSAGAIVQKINDSAAENTGKYLLSIRTGLVDLQIKHEAFLQGIDTSGAPAGTYPTPPSFITWVTAPGTSGGQIATGSVQNLIDGGYLSPGFALYPPLGQKALWLLHRKGTCPPIASNDVCEIEAFVYTCHPISAERSTALAGTNCTTLSGNRAEADPSLIGQAMMSVEGYGGTDILNKDFFTGAVIGHTAPRDLFPSLSNHQGRMVVAAGLNTTQSNQFVRHGETRPVYLNNTLTVRGSIETRDGLIMNPSTPISAGQTCTKEGMYATTDQKTLAVCTGGSWYPLTNYLVKNVRGNVAHNTRIQPVSCPAPMVMWQQASLESSDFRITGTAINLYGNHSGNVTGSGNVNASGSYNINGNFNAEFKNNPNSYVDSKQVVSMNTSGVVSISPNGTAARAIVIQGCRIP